MPPEGGNGNQDGMKMAMLAYGSLDLSAEVFQATL